MAPPGADFGRTQARTVPRNNAQKLSKETELSKKGIRDRKISFI
jgi:hypothetical protein